MERSKFTSFLILVLASLAAGGFLYYKLQQTATGPTTQPSAVAPAPVATPQPAQVPSPSTQPPPAPTQIAPGQYKVIFRQSQPETTSVDQEGTTNITVAQDAVFALISPSDTAEATVRQLIATVYKRECTTKMCSVMLFDDAKAIDYEREFLGMTKEKAATMSPDELNRFKTEFGTVKLPAIMEHQVATYQPGGPTGYMFEYYPAKNQTQAATGSQSPDQTASPDTTN